MVKVYLDDGTVGVSYAGGEILCDKITNMWLWLLGAIKDKEKIVICDNRLHLQEHQSLLCCVVNDTAKADVFDNDACEHIRANVKRAEQVLIDNGIEASEVETVMQAIGYALLDTELYPEQ